MRRNLAALRLLLTIPILITVAMPFVLITAAIQQSQSPEDSLPEGSGTLKWHAQQAKAQGKNQVVFTTTSMATPVDVPGLEDLCNYTVIVAELVKKKSVPESPYQTDILTWNKFKIIETLSQKKEPYEGPLPDDIPRELLPLANDEVLVYTSGGSLVIDGVEVISKRPSSPNFLIGNKYLLFLEMESSGKHGIIETPFAVFSITSDEGLWTSVRNFLRRFRGVHKKYLKYYVAMCEHTINLRRVTPAFIALLVGTHKGWT